MTLTLTRLSHWTSVAAQKKTSSTCLLVLQCVCAVVDKHQLMVQMQMRQLQLLLSLLHMIISLLSSVCGSSVHVDLQPSPVQQQSLSVSQTVLCAPSVSVSQPAPTANYL